MSIKVYVHEEYKHLNVINVLIHVAYFVILEGGALLRLW